MARRKKNHYRMFRHPKTTQERKSNIKNPYVRGKRRRLPNAWDDICIRSQKGWKYLGRKNQYREKDLGYSWHEFKYSYNERQIAIDIDNWLNQIQCFHEWTGGGIRWFGPTWFRKGYCPRCYTKLISDEMSESYGNWCPNPDCTFIQEQKKWST